MPREAKQKRFATEAEEAAWWEANASNLAEEFEKTITVGRARGATLVVTGDSTVAKIQLPAKDIAMLRKQAKKHEMNCPQYLGMLLHDALTKAEKGRKSAA